MPTASSTKTQRVADQAQFESELAKRDAAAHRDAKNADLKARLERLEQAILGQANR